MTCDYYQVFFLSRCPERFQDLRELFLVWAMLTIFTQDILCDTTTVQAVQFQLLKYSAGTKPCVVASALHILKLERYRED